MCYLNIPNCSLVKAETIEGQRVADKWSTSIQQLEGQYKAAKKILEQKRSTLLGTLFGDDCGSENEPSMFDVLVRVEDRHKALLPYLDAVTALKHEIINTTYRRNSQVINADKAFRTQLSLNDLIEFQ
jgi:hypothetical protein